ncbi:MAG TPA: GNAT family N-acetyltransferase [Bacteroidales bacterium]|nr:GNAT family N-acetyltransferase [Bacteroidales bacterium]
MKIRRVNRYSTRLFEAILKLLPQLDQSCPLPSEGDIRSIIGNRDIRLVVAEMDDKSVAGMLTMASYRIPSGRKFWIDDVIVDEDHRGMKIGRDLMMFAIAMAKSEGAKSIDLTSRPFRKAANQLYSDLGFKRRETNVYRLSLD